MIHIKVKLHNLGLLVFPLALSGCQQHTEGVASEASVSSSPFAQVKASGIKALQSTNDQRMNQISNPSSISVASNSLQCRFGTHDHSGAERAFVELQESGARIFETALPLPDKDFYQNRVSHCLVANNAIYALEQVDTQPQQTMKQTLLYIAKLSTDGKLLQTSYIDPRPNDDKSLTAWVEPDAGNFVLQADGSILVHGKWKHLHGDGSEHTFTQTIKQF